MFGRGAGGGFGGGGRVTNAIPPDILDPSVSLTNLKPGTAYACCVAPFIAYADDANDVAGDHGSKRPRDATLTVRIPGHGRAALPRSFAEAFITAVPALDSGVVAPDAPVQIHVPEDNVDSEQPVFATNVDSVSGWRRVGTWTPKAPTPPPLLGSRDERCAVASANAGLALCEMEAVPHAVVPRPVLRHIVGPFVMRLLCTVKQACLGVTALNAGPDFPLAAVPNVTELSLTELPVTPLPPRTATLAVGSGFGMGIPPVPSAPVRLNSTCGLTKLDLRETYPASYFDGVPPIPTVRTVTLASLLDMQAAESQLFLRTMATLTPNATALEFTVVQCALDATTLFSDQTMWPLLTELDFGGPAPCAAAMATARAWRTVNLCWEVSQLFGPKRAVAVAFPDGLAEQIIAQSRLDPSLLESMTIRASARDIIPLSDLLRFFPPQCENLKSLVLPDCDITLASPESQDPVVSSFLAGAHSLEEVRFHDVDFGTGACKKKKRRFDPVTPPSEPVVLDVEMALLSAAFAAPVRSVGSVIRELQWTRSKADPQCWVSSPLPLQQETARGFGWVRKDTHQPQMLLVPDS